MYLGNFLTSYPWLFVQPGMADVRLSGAGIQYLYCTGTCSSCTMTVFPRELFHKSLILIPAFQPRKCHTCQVRVVVAAFCRLQLYIYMQTSISIHYKNTTRKTLARRQTKQLFKWHCPLFTSHCLSQASSLWEKAKLVLLIEYTYHACEGVEGFHCFFIFL